MYLSLRAMRYISAELLYACYTVSVWIMKCLPDQATTNNIALQIGFTVKAQVRDLRYNSGNLYPTAS